MTKQIYSFNWIKGRTTVYTWVNIDNMKMYNSNEMKEILPLYQTHYITQQILQFVGEK